MGGRSGLNRPGALCPLGYVAPDHTPTSLVLLSPLLVSVGLRKLTNTALFIQPSAVPLGVHTP